MRRNKRKLHPSTIILLIGLVLMIAINVYTGGIGFPKGLELDAFDGLNNKEAWNLLLQSGLEPKDYLSFIGIALFGLWGLYFLVWVIFAIYRFVRRGMIQYRDDDIQKMYGKNNVQSNSWKTIDSKHLPSRATPGYVYGWIGLVLSVLLTIGIVFLVKDATPDGIIKTLKFFGTISLVCIVLIVRGEIIYRKKIKKTLELMNVAPDVVSSSLGPNPKHSPLNNGNDRKHNTDEGMQKDTQMEDWELQMVKERANKNRNLIFAAGLGVLMLPLSFIIPFPIIIAIAALFYFFMEKKRKKEQGTADINFKRDIVPNYLNQHFQDVIYRPANGLNSQLVLNSGLIVSGSIYNTNDYISAKYQGLTFEQADVKVQTRQSYRDKDDNLSTSVVTHFSGRWLVFPYQKAVSDPFYLWSNNFQSFRTDHLKSQGYEKVALEQMSFNNYYSVYSRNPHNVFYILTPVLMERLNQLFYIEDQVGIKQGIGIKWDGHQIQVAISNTNDAFETGIFTANPRVQMETDLSLMKDIMDLFR